MKIQKPCVNLDLQKVFTTVSTSRFTHGFVGTGYTKYKPLWMSLKLLNTTLDENFEERPWDLELFFLKVGSQIKSKPIIFLSTWAKQKYLCLIFNNLKKWRECYFPFPGNRLFVMSPKYHKRVPSIFNQDSMVLSRTMYSFIPSLTSISRHWRIMYVLQRNGT